MSPALAWALLLLGGLFEVGFTTSLRFVEGFRNGPWVAAFVVCVTASMLLLQQAARVIPMATAYAVWVGIGAAGTLGVGYMLGEPIGPVRLLLVVLIIAAVIGLKLVA